MLLKIRDILCNMLNIGVLYLYTLGPRQNGRHFADDIFKRIFLNENVRISIKISLKYVSKVPINNIPALLQIMAYRRPGDKPLSGTMMVGFTHICVTRPQWVNRGTVLFMPGLADLKLDALPCISLLTVRGLCHQVSYCVPLSMLTIQKSKYRIKFASFNGEYDMITYELIQPMMAHQSLVYSLNLDVLYAYYEDPWLFPNHEFIHHNVPRPNIETTLVAKIED